jgi:elongation of very long chain fatty acids protein 4
VPLEWIHDLEAKILAAGAVGWNATVPAPLDDLPTKDWPLVSLETALSIAGGYLAFVAIGCAVMPFLPAVSDRVMYPLKFVYNVVQIFLCAYMSVEAAVLAYRNNFSVFPWPQNNAFNAAAPVVGNLMWMFYISKILDFFDTFTIVTQKKWKQLSFLHVYHHSSVFLFYWINIRLAYDGDIFLTILLNGSIHTVMYTYYFIAMHTKDIWWKKYLTQMQMVQFCLMLTQGACMIFNGDVSFPPRLSAMYFGYIVTMLGLFMHFYLQSYTKKSKGEKVEKKA